jgi:hypothetical protein
MPDKPESKSILAQRRKGAKRIAPVFVFLRAFASSRENSSHKNYEGLK